LDKLNQAVFRKLICDLKIVSDGEAHTVHAAAAAAKRQLENSFAVYLRPVNNHFG